MDCIYNAPGVYCNRFVVKIFTRNNGGFTRFHPVSGCQGTQTQTCHIQITIWKLFVYSWMWPSGEKNCFNISSTERISTEVWLQNWDICF